MNATNWQEVKRLFHQAVDLRPDERSNLLEDSCNGNKDLRGRVELLLRAHEQAGEFMAQPALVETGLLPDGYASSFAESLWAGRLIGGYQIIRELGSGGMGAVFLATGADGQSEKQVALKIVKRGMDTESILRRFVTERQILANLEHKSIARFLDGGTTDDGLPYFVMEYVEGEPITKYCDTRNLSTNERLRLFRKVCAAVQHAHQNLIVHRDLKPSNILVSADRAPKLLDFGIAKLLNSDSSSDATDETASALRLMTPEYASPEQVRGLPITTATDVYSLGIVLYELLSGHRPFRFPSRAPDEIARVVLTQEPTRPSDAVTRHEDPRATDAVGPPTTRSVNHSREGHVEKLRRRLVGDLDNIVLKALRKDRDRRYASVQEFSEDIRRHLSGLPVTARPDTFSYRAGKFIRRHGAGVSVAAMVMVTLLAATVITSWQAHVAQREHAKAELRSAEQRKLASSLINEVQKSLKDVPHSLTAQRLLAQKSLEYLNNLAKDTGDDPEFLGELAATYQNLGYLQAWTLQDNTSALQTYEKAIELSRRRLAIVPNSFAARHALSDMLGNKIESLELMRRADDASATFAEQLGIEQQLLNEDGQNPERLMWVAESSEAHGEVLRSLQQTEEAKTKFEAAVELSSQAIQLSKPQAINPQERVDLSLMQEKLASMYEQLNETPQAAQAYREANAIASAVHAEHPEIVQALRNTTSSHWFLGLVLDRQGDHQGALEHYRASLKTVLDATAADPSVDPARSGETKYSIVVGRALCKLGQKEEGVNLIRHGVEMTLNIIESDKGNRQDIYFGSELLTWAVDGLAAAGLRDEAKNISLKMIGWAEEATRNSPEDGGPRLRLVLLYEQLGDVFAGYNPDRRKIGTMERARLLEARGYYEKGFNVLREIDAPFKIPKSILQEPTNDLQEKLSECDAMLGG